MTDGTGTTAYSYNSQDWMTKEVTGSGTSGAQTVQFGYDLAGNATKITYPGPSGSAPAITRTFDANERLSSITDWLTNKTSFAYNPNSLLSKITYPNNTTAAFSYTKYQPGELDKIVDNQGTTALWTFLYGRDALGNVTTVTDPLDTIQHSYAYDSLLRQNSDTQTSGGTSVGTMSWSFDAADQLKSITDTAANTSATYTYDHAHQLSAFQKLQGATQQQNLTLSYNANGDRTQSVDSVSGNTTTYGYDQANRLTTYQKAVSLPQYSYGYNGDGLRVAKTVNGATTTSVWDTSGGMPQIIQDGSTRYVIGPDEVPIEQIDGSNTPLYYYQDQLGSTRGLLDQSGNVAATFTYDAYGNLKASTGSGTTPFGYAGQFTDGESGLQYLRARYYDPNTEQFVSVDPFAVATMEDYAYSVDNPLNEVDPTGLCADNVSRTVHLSAGQLANARLICKLARRAGLSRGRAREMVAAAMMESSLTATTVNSQSGAAGLFQLLSPVYLQQASRCGGPTNPGCNTRTILPQYLEYWRLHPHAHQGQAAQAVEASGASAAWYAQPLHGGNPYSLPWSQIGSGC